MNEPIGVTILGSTGSIGVNTLDVLQRHPDRFRVVALTAHQDVETLLRQCLIAGIAFQYSHVNHRVEILFLHSTQ